jgi:hypothetical protein
MATHDPRLFASLFHNVSVENQVVARIGDWGVKPILLVQVR